MKTTINGEVFEFEPHSDETAVDVIRDRAKLTGTKLVCGSGACGACTIICDGVPVNSCLLPAQALIGRSIQTIEFFGADKLHPIQRAFIAHDGLQCGFCTPGFILEGIAFYKSWRKLHGKQLPDRSEVAKAMAGHLCRCGAYVEIIAAIQRACAGDFDNTDELVSPRSEAIYKATGLATYTVDIQYDGQLEGCIVRSPHPHAKVISISKSAAAAMDGVKAVVDLLDDEHDVVRYIGQPVVGVAAISAQVAKKAMDKIDIEYEVRPFVTDIESARDRSAPLVYPENKNSYPNISQGPIIPGRWTGNVRAPLTNIILGLSRRKVRQIINKAQDSADLEIVSGTWRTAAQVHCSFEPHACVALWEDDEHLTVHVSTQDCNGMASAIADLFSVPRTNVSVYCQYVGGAFGAKQELGSETIAAIVLSQVAGLPVRVSNSWRDEMAYGGYRSAVEIDLTLVANQQGEMKALIAKAYSSGGTGINSMVAALMSLVYRGAPKALLDFDVVTNLPPGKPFRGPFGPPAYWALEQAVDEIAYKTDQDPVALRRRWDHHQLRQKLYAWVDQIPAWKERGAVGQNTGRHQRGIGVAIGNWLNYYRPEAQIELTASENGFTAKTASQDTGNGTSSVIAHAVSSEFGISPSAIEVLVGDSGTVPGPASTGSATTNAVFYPSTVAARKLRKLLITAAQKELDLVDVRLGNGGIIHAAGQMKWKELLSQISTVSVVTKRGADEAINFNKLLPLSLSVGRGTTGIVYVSEVEVDRLLGRVRVLRVWGGLAAGKIVVPTLAKSQIHGGIIQGIGYALYEERSVDPATGASLSTGLNDYYIPSIYDTPKIELFFCEEGFKHVKGGAVGLSELSTLPVAASIGNAVFHATGQRFYDLPLNPARILEGIGV